MSARSVKFLLAILCLLSGAGLTGCNSPDSATLNLSVADTPVDDATSIMVTFTGVQLQGDGGSMIEYTFDMPKQIDLLEQQDGNSASLLEGVGIPAGNYQWIRLVLDTSQSSITLNDGSVHALTIPSGDQTGLKLVSGFTVAAGNIADFTIDFNLRQSITSANGGYILKPALRLINNQQVGKISGSVSNTFSLGNTAVSDPACAPAAYVYAGTGITPMDISPSATVQPVETAGLSLDNVSGSYVYTAAFLPPGDYTVALVCAARDDPALADNLTFSTAKTATVAANQTTSVNFP